MRHRVIAPWLCVAALLSTAGSARAGEDEQAFGAWKVETVSPTTIRASAHGARVYGHMFALIASAKACEEPFFWISWAAQGPEKPKVEQFKVGEPVQLAISAGGKVSRVEMPLIAARPLTSSITVFALTNVAVPKDLLGELAKAEEVNVTVEKPEWLASKVLDPEDSFSLGGFAPAFRAMSQRCSGIAEAATCPGVDLAVRTWAGLVEGPTEGRREYLAKLGACAARTPEFRARVDYVAVDALDAIGAVPEGSRGRWTVFVADVLRLNANAGEKASQHNLAGMYNAEPGTTLARSFGQDHGRFIYWTRRAASQGEPRAMFNLAVRLAAGDASAGVLPDPALAYQTYLALEPMLIRYRPQLDQLHPVVEGAKLKLEQELGEERTKALKKSAGSFSLAALAPAGSEPALGR